MTAPQPTHRLRWLRRGVVFTVVLVALYGLPALLPDIREAVAGLAHVAPTAMLAAAALEVASLACFSALSVRLLGPGRRPGFGTLLRIDVAVYGLGRVLPAAPATGGALRYRLLTAAGVRSDDAVFVAAVEGTGSALLLYVMLGAALVVFLPVHGAGLWEVIAAVAGIVVAAAAVAGAVLVARNGAGLRKLVERLARRVPGVDTERVLAALGREGEHLRALAADRLRLAEALGWGAANWLFDAAALWVVVAATGYRVMPLALFVAYAVAGLVGVLPVTPGGVGIVEGVLVPALVACGVPAHAALVGVLGWRLVNYWLPIPVGGLLWLTLRRHPGRPRP